MIMRKLTHKVDYFGTRYYLVQKGKRTSKLCLENRVATRTIGGFLGVPRQRIYINTITVPTKNISEIKVNKRMVKK